MLKDVEAIPSDCLAALLIYAADTEEDFLKKRLIKGNNKIVNKKTATTAQLVAR